MMITQLNASSIFGIVVFVIIMMTIGYIIGKGSKQGEGIMQHEYCPCGRKLLNGSTTTDPYMLTRYVIEKDGTERLVFAQCWHGEIVVQEDKSLGITTTAPCVVNEQKKNF